MDNKGIKSILSCWFNACDQNRLSLLYEFYFHFCYTAQYKNQLPLLSQCPLSEVQYSWVLFSFSPGSQIGFVVSKSFPGGEQNFAFEFPLRKFQPVLYTSDEEFLVCLGFEKLKPHLYIHSNKTGSLVHKILIKYAGFKGLATEINSDIILYLAGPPFRCFFYILKTTGGLYTPLVKIVFS